MQISTCNSPHPQIIYWCVFSSTMHWTIGSKFSSFLNASISFGRSSYFLGLIATLTTGDTENFIFLKGNGFSAVVKVAVFLIN